MAVTGGVTPHGWLSVSGYALPVLGGAYSLGSCYWFSARRGLATWAGVLRLAMAVRVFRLGLAALCIRGRVFPELAGLGKMKVNSNVPPIARVSGQCLGDEASGPLGSFLPFPADGEDNTIEEMKGDIRAVRVSMLVVETMTSISLMLCGRRISNVKVGQAM